MKFIQKSYRKNKSGDKRSLKFVNSKKTKFMNKLIAKLMYTITNIHKCLSINNNYILQAPVMVVKFSSCNIL